MVSLLKNIIYFQSSCVRLENNAARLNDNRMLFAWGISEKHAAQE